VFNRRRAGWLCAGGAGSLSGRIAAKLRSFAGLARSGKNESELGRSVWGLMAVIPTDRAPVPPKIESGGRVAGVCGGFR
jgi:hypothetical protein